MDVMWWTMIATAVLGVPFLLWWWRDADKWLADEHKRFKVKPDPRERVVVKTPGRKGDGGAGDAR